MSSLPKSILLILLFFILVTVGFYWLRPTPPASDEEGFASDRPLHLLLVGDPFAYAIDNRLEYLSTLNDETMRLSIRRYSRTYETILSNHEDRESYYHLVSFDILWLPSLAQRGILEPLSIEELREFGFDPGDHHAITLTLNKLNGTLYGLPIQPHPELLWYRRDLLEEAGFSPPETTEELITQARHFHRPEDRFYGITWNALRGQALGQTVTHLFAAFDCPIIDADHQLHVDCPAGEKVGNFLLELMEVSPPDILSMAWDQRIERFARGRSAFTYGWMARNSRVERDPLSRVRGQVGYTLPPSSQRNNQAVPMGQWSLGIPANLSEDERERALRALVSLVSDEADKILIQEGFYGHHRSRGSTIEDKRTNDPGYEIVYQLLKEGNISKGARPMIPQWADLAETLGLVFHDLIRGDIDLPQTLEIAHQRLEEILPKP